MESSPRSAEAALLEGRMAIAVVGRAFLRIAQRLVCLAEFLKSLLGSMIAWVFIGMKLYRQLAVGPLYVLFAGFTVDAEHFIVIAFPGHQAGGPFETITLAGRIKTILQFEALAELTDHRPSATSGLGSWATASCKFGSK